MRSIFALADRAGEPTRPFSGSRNARFEAADGCIPRIARLMALAIRFEGLLRDETIRDYAELARLGRVTRARMTQIMKLLDLAPDIQEQILFLPLLRLPPTMAASSKETCSTPPVCGTGHVGSTARCRTHRGPDGQSARGEREFRQDHKHHHRRGRRRAEEVDGPRARGAMPHRRHQIH